MVHRATPAQLRAARALIGWSQTDLAVASGVSVRTIKKLELSEDLDPLPGRPVTVDRLVRALRQAGVRLTGGRSEVGVSLSLPTTHS